MKLRQGFTLIELMTVIGVAAVLIAIGFPSMVAMRQNAALNGGTQEFISVLRQAQGQAIAGQGNSDQTIHFISTSQYQEIGGTTNTLPSGIVFSSVHADITFARRYGTTTATTVDVIGGSVTKHVSITATGLVTLQ